MTSSQPLQVVEQLKYASTTQRNVAIDGCPIIDIYHHQIVLVASLSRADVLELPNDVQRFPVVLDSGFNGTVLIKEDHLRHWAGISKAELEPKTTLNFEETEISVREATLWLYLNVPLSRTKYLNSPPVQFEIDPGIFVAPNDFPRRLPLLGLKTLTDLGANVLMDCANEYASIRLG